MTPRTNDRPLVCATCVYARPATDDRVICARAVESQTPRPPVGQGSGCLAHRSVARMIGDDHWLARTVMVATPPELLRLAKPLPEADFAELLAAVDAGGHERPLFLRPTRPKKAQPPRPKHDPDLIWQYTPAPEAHHG